MRQKYLNITKILREFMNKNFKSLMKISRSNLKHNNSFNHTQKHLSTTEKYFHFLIIYFSSIYFIKKKLKKNNRNIMTVSFDLFLLCL